MEEYPEELRTPPIALVSLVGCPELHQTISIFLHSEQLPINTLALPDFSKISILSRKPKDPLDAGGHPPGGILKRDWLLKHRTRIPAVAAALFSSDQVTGDPALWQQVCADIDHTKAIVRGRNIRFVVLLVQKNVRDDVSEDQMNALRKRAELDSKHAFVFVQNDAAELKQSLNRLAGIFAELCNIYYREEGRRIKSRIEKKSAGSVEVNIRYCYKVAVFAEFRKDWTEALRFYEEAYNATREIVGTTTRLPPIQRLVEIKAVAEQLHFKITTLLLQGGKNVEGIVWFNKHSKNYEKLVGASEVAFLHWEWFSRQFLVFAELLERNDAAMPNNHSSQFSITDSALTEWELRPAYYYELAAHYLREKRFCLERLLTTTEYAELVNMVEEIPESVVPSTYVGQYCRLFEQGDAIQIFLLSDAEYARFAIADGQRFQDSYEIIALFRKSCELFNGLNAPRTAAYCSHGMAREYFTTGDLNNAKQLFDGVAGLYRQEGWITLLWETLGYLRECSQKLGSLKDFVQYSLEMAALPIFSSGGLEAHDGKREYGPAGPPTLSHRETIQQEVFSLLKGRPRERHTDLFESGDQPISVDIDLVSPLRMAFLVSVAFHNQTVKPGLSSHITVSIISQLPHPVEIDQLEVQFNQPFCNFIVMGEEFSAKELKANNHDTRIESVPSLILTTNKWLPLTFEIRSSQSGKLECMAVNAKVGHDFTLCCRGESPASMEGLTLWKFEDLVETFPAKGPMLSFSGQKYIQVEEPDPQVDLNMSASSIALVGENFIIPVSVVSKGHEVHSAELKINLVDARGGGLLMSPRDTEPFSSDNHHVELLSVSGVFEDDSKSNSDSIKKIQQSFGVVSVPFLGVGQSWSCRLEIKWNRPKSVMLYVSLGYLPNAETNSQRVNVHRSLQIEGKIPFTICQHFMMPFRREPLLLSKVKSVPHVDQNMLLPLNETSILVVSARNCSEIPLRLISVSVEPDGNQGAGCSCTVQRSGTVSTCPLILPGEDFKQIFTVAPEIISPNLDIGTVHLKWARDSNLSLYSNSLVVTKQKVPSVSVEAPPLVVSLECPPHAVLGVPFSFHIKVGNYTSLLQEINYSLGDSQTFVFTGHHSDSVFILPKSEHIISYKIVPLFSGLQHLPVVTVTSVRYLAAMNPSHAATTLFVFPSEPQIGVGQKSELVSASC